MAVAGTEDDPSDPVLRPLSDLPLLRIVAIAVCGRSCSQRIGCPHKLFYVMIGMCPYTSRGSVLQDQVRWLLPLSVIVLDA